MPSRVSFEDLATADLVVRAVYEGGTAGNAADDPMAQLLPCGNQGGFRIRGERATHSYRVALLYTSGADPDWPGGLDPETGVLHLLRRQQATRIGAAPDAAWRAPAVELELGAADVEQLWTATLESGQMLIAASSVSASSLSATM